MSYDLVIRNGMLVDGTGAPRKRADIAIAAGKIAEIGKVTDGAKKVLDASDLIVAPGFVDPHTHYDAQICWDPYLASSSSHGVTSVIMGNCGVGIAPCQAELREIAAADLVNVEAIPFEVLRKGITWDWETFPQYIDAAAQRGSGINLGFLAPLTPFRHYVMGEESMQRAATVEETAKIKSMVKEAVAAGALGFTTSTLPQHIGYQGRPLACRNASREEFKAYANALKELGRGTIEMALTRTTSVLSDEEYEFLDFILTESGRPATWLAVLYRDEAPDACIETLHKAEPLIRRGGVPQVTCRPLIVQVNLRDPFIFAEQPSWKPVFNQPPEVQKKYYRDQKFRDEWRASLNKGFTRFGGRWDRIAVNDVRNPALPPLVGRTVAEIALERGKDGVDTFLDLGLEDDLGIEFTFARYNADESKIPGLINDPRTMIGLSDAGAHVDMLCDAGYCTFLLGTWVREREVMTLEHAIKRITSEPADYFGIKKRGRLLPGMAADAAIFDYNTVGSARRGEMRKDLPGGGRRLVMPAQGVEHVIVNGRMLYEHGKASGSELPGEVLRSATC
jgi:N-acyl-D-aspartate/D-glutamate deacylase